MAVATVSLDLIDNPTLWDNTDSMAVASSILAVLDLHFSCYDNASRAKSEHLRVRAQLSSEPCLDLFGAAEAVRASLSAHPEAAAWESFVRDATAGIGPFRFAIRFSATD